MVSVAVRVDKCRVTGLLVSALICAKIGCPPAGVLRVNDNDPIRRDEDGCISTAPLAPQHEQVVLKLFNFDNLGRVLSDCDGELERADDGEY